jgi:UTP--glucose-1-phosphate uridylyltransferase
MNIRKAVIPAAGFGTRFLPATKAVPKEMIPVVDKPLIQYSVEEAVRSGISHIGVITSRNKSAMEDHFDGSPELEAFLQAKNKLAALEDVNKAAGLAQFGWIRQRQALGLGHAILMAEAYVGGETFAALLPDDIFVCQPDAIRQLLNAHEKYGTTIIILGRVDEEGTKKYGIVRADQVEERIFKVHELVEKPGPEKAFSDLAILGRYVFTPDIFNEIKATPPDHRGEIQITDAINRLAQTKEVYGVLFDGERFDCGNKLGFIEGTIAMALKRPEFRNEVKDLLKKFLDQA